MRTAIIVAVNAATLALVAATFYRAGRNAGSVEQLEFCNDLMDEQLRQTRETLDTVRAMHSDALMQRWTP